MNLRARTLSILAMRRDVACDVALEAVAALPAQPSKAPSWNLRRPDARVESP
jgi:hypothetical protein